MMKNFLSIIIPTYNEEKYIGDSLSRLKSTLTLPHEVIVTDDKSLDSTVTIAQKYADTVLVPEKKHATIAQNRNEGARVAKGEFLVFMDSDSTMTNPDQFFAHTLGLFRKDEKLVAVTAELWVLPELETAADRIVYIVFNWVHRFKNNVVGSGEASGKFQMIRRTAFDTIGGFREDLVTREDADMFQRLSKIGHVRCDKNLQIFHTGRRAHKIGWPKLLSIWMIESFKFAAGGKSKITEWRDVR